MGRTFVIAEAGVNHCGSLPRAIRMVEAAAACGADAVKFQTFRADLLASPAAATAEYQRAAVGAGSQLEMLRALELSEDAHLALAARCLDVGIEFMSTPFDVESARFLASIGVRRMKIPSGELTNDGFLGSIAGLGLPVILSTGMATMDEVRHAVGVVERHGIRGTGSLVLLHCTSSYPTLPGDANLLAIRSIAAATGLPVGYSDHTLGIQASLAAVALGARVIEKHFTLDRSLPGPDHCASLTVDECAALVKGIREVEELLGDGEKRPMASELEVGAVARRSVAAARPIAAGRKIDAADLTCLRPGTGIPPSEIGLVVGRTACRDFGAGELLSWEALG
jgi:N-acetylneuraminate synthase